VNRIDPVDVFRGFDRFDVSNVHRAASLSERTSTHSSVLTVSALIS
jgi:hypothetical protein